MHCMKKTDLSKVLNEEQCRAAETLEGPLLIIAGAGSGKTRMITYRIAHMLEEGIDEKNILALTFTNKAAKEMSDRIRGLLKKPLKGLTATTFHAFGLGILTAGFGRTAAEGNKHVVHVGSLSLCGNDDSVRSGCKTLSTHRNGIPVSIVNERLSAAADGLSVKADIFSVQRNFDNAAVDNLIFNDHTGHKIHIRTGHIEYDLAVSSFFHFECKGYGIACRTEVTDRLSAAGISCCFDKAVAVRRSSFDLSAFSLYLDIVGKIRLRLGFFIFPGSR